MRRTMLSAAAPACLLLGLSPVAAAADVAPPGNATATAAQVSNLVGISSTGASADASRGEAHAAVVSLGGKPALGTGGAQSQEGSSGGALLDTSDKPLPVRLKVAPWHTSINRTPRTSHRSSRASAALAEVDVPGGGKVGVLTSDSQAEHSPEQSTATGTSDALNMGLGDTTRLVLLHSEVSSTGKGHSYLVGLNGTEIGTDDQLGKSCALDASGVASLSCLTASGGTANGLTRGAAEVLGVQTALGLNPVAAFSTAARSGTGSTPPPSILPVVANPVAAAETARTVTPAPASAPAALPRTGVAILSAAASALAALLSGLVLRLLGRRRLAA